MKDRVVQFPRRYQLVPVDGEMNVYDFVPVPGTVTEAGTPINKATLLNDETATLYGLTGDDATVNKAFLGAKLLSPSVALQYGLAGTNATVENALRRSSMSSHIAFCGNVNADMLDAAFGKNNDVNMLGMGRQLAMYAWFKGSTLPFTNLQLADNLLDITSDINIIGEIYSDAYILPLIYSSPYANSVWASMSEALRCGGISKSLNISVVNSFDSLFNIDSDVQSAFSRNPIINDLIRHDSILTKIYTTENTIYHMLDSQTIASKLTKNSVFQATESTTRSRLASLVTKGRFTATNYTTNDLKGTWMTWNSNDGNYPRWYENRSKTFVRFTRFLGNSSDNYSGSANVQHGSNLATIIEGSSRTVTSGNWLSIYGCRNNIWSNGTGIEGASQNIVWTRVG